MATIESELLNKNALFMLTVYSLISAQVMNPCTNRYLLDTGNQEKNGNSINMVKKRRHLHQEFHLSKKQRTVEILPLWSCLWASMTEFLSSVNQRKKLVHVQSRGPASLWHTFGHAYWHFEMCKKKGEIHHRVMVFLAVCRIWQLSLQAQTVPCNQEHELWSMLMVQPNKWKTGL